MSIRVRVHRPFALALHSAVLTALLGGAVGYALIEKTVTVIVDGQPRAVTTHGGTVRDVLADGGLSAGAHDLLAPSADAPVDDGDRIALRRGRLLSLVVDGRRRDVWVTAVSVDEALGQLGLRAEGAVLSASRSRRIPLSGLSFAVRTPKAVSILVDGHVVSVTTTGPTVRDALMQAGVRLGRADRLSAPRAALLTDRMIIRVTRIEGRRVVESYPIPFQTERRVDPAMYRGDQKVLVPGRPGVLLRTYTLSFVNGRLTAKLLGSEVQTAAPVTQVVVVGTKARPAASRSVGGADGLNWPALARCESGGNPRAVSRSGTYRGLYQFAMSTWRGVGGTGDPIDASPSEQTYRAKILYSRSGRSAWPVCGKYL